MKLLQLCNKMPYPPKDGGAKAIYNVAKGLKRLGVIVDILAMNTHKHFVKDDAFKSAEVNIEAIPVNSQIHLGGLLFNLFFSKIPYTASRFLNEEYAQAIIKKLTQNEYDVIQFEGLYVLPYIPLIKRHSKARLVYRAHNVESKIWKRAVQEENNFFKKLYINILSKRLLRYELSLLNTYDAILPITKKDERELNKMGNESPSLVLPFGMDLSNVRGESHQTFKSLFYIGALDWIPNQKGLQWFIQEVYLNLKTKVPFRVAGRNCPKEFELFLKSHGVDFLGEIDDVEPLYKENTVLVMPLFSGSGMRVKIVEAMAYEKVVITTAVGIEGNEAKHSKEVFIGNKSEDYHEVIEHLFANPTEIREIGQNARKFVLTSFDQEYLTQSLIDFYERN